MISYFVLQSLHQVQYVIVKIKKKNNKDGLPSLKYYGAVVLTETEVQLQSISTMSNFMSSVKFAIVWKSWGNLVPPEMQILLDLVAHDGFWALLQETVNENYLLTDLEKATHN